MRAKREELMGTDQEIIFARTLEKVKKLAREQGNSIEKEQVEDAFRGLDLSKEQLSLVFEYLEKNKIGIGTVPDPDEFLSREEIDYLEEYKKELAGLAELAEGEKTRLLRFEGEILQWVLQGHGREARDVPSILQGLAREFHQPDKGREMVIGMEGEEGQAQAFSALYLHFALWLVMARFLAISPAYRVKAQAACLEEGHFRLKVEGSFPEGVWEQKNREGAESAMTNVVHKILGKVAVRFSQAIQEGKVTYQIEI